MTKTPTTPAAPEAAHLRRLVEERLGRDVVKYARALRASTDPPMSWNRIARDIMDSTSIYLTQEAVRRWVAADDRRLAAQNEQAAA